MEQVKKKKDFLCHATFCGQLARAREGVCFEFQLDPLSSSLSCSSSLSPCRADEMMVGFQEIERQEKEEERTRIVLIDDAGVDGRRSNIYHVPSATSDRPAISLSILVQFDLKSLDPPATATFPIRSGSISTPQLARLFIHLIPFHSSPFVLVHLSFTTSSYTFCPFIYGPSTATAITFIPLFPSDHSISFQRLDRVFKQLQNT